MANAEIWKEKVVMLDLHLVRSSHKVHEHQLSWHLKMFINTNYIYVLLLPESGSH